MRKLFCVSDKSISNEEKQIYETEAPQPNLSVCILAKISQADLIFLF